MPDSVRLAWPGADCIVLHDAVHDHEEYFRKGMKRFYQVPIALFLIFALYVMWPLVGLKKIGDAVEARDVVELSARINAMELKRSLSDQLGRAYLLVSGKDQTLGPLAQSLALQVINGLVDARVSEMVKPETLIDFLNEAGATSLADGAISRATWSDLPNLRNFFTVILQMEYSGSNFYITIPFVAGEVDGFRLHLRLSDWTWKLSGLRLPEAILLRFTREIVEKSGK